MQEVILSSFDSHFAAGRAVCLFQTYDVISPYYCGTEGFPYCFDVNDGLDRRAALLQYYDQLHLSGASACFLSMFDHLIDYQSRVHLNSDEVVHSDYDGFCFHTCAYQFDVNITGHGVVYLDVSDMVLDQYTDMVRNTAWLSYYAISEVSFASLLFTVDCEATTYGGMLFSVDAIRYQTAMLHFQEESYFDYFATFVNVRDSSETSVFSNDEFGLLAQFRSEIVGIPDSEYQVELMTLVQHYAANNVSQQIDYVLWRFLLDQNKQYRVAPAISSVSATEQQTSYELFFSATWPYAEIRGSVDSFSVFQQEEGDFFDLGIWTSDQLLVDTTSLPLLTVPYDAARTNYAVHVPKASGMKFIAIAPIRMFPFEEVGALTVISVV